MKMLGLYPYCIYGDWNRSNSKNSFLLLSFSLKIPSHLKVRNSIGKWDTRVQVSTPALRFETQASCIADWLQGSIVAVFPRSFFSKQGKALCAYQLDEVCSCELLTEVFHYL